MQEWDARFRNNLLQLSWQPNRPADLIEADLARRERILILTIYRWRHPELRDGMAEWRQHSLWHRRVHTAAHRIICRRTLQAFNSWRVCHAIDRTAE